MTDDPALSKRCASALSSRYFLMIPGELKDEASVQEYLKKQHSIENERMALEDWSASGKPIEQWPSEVRAILERAEKSGKEGKKPAAGRTLESRLQ